MSTGPESEGKRVGVETNVGISQSYLRSTYIPIMSEKIKEKNTRLEICVLHTHASWASLIATSPHTTSYDCHIGDQQRTKATGWPASLRAPMNEANAPLWSLVAV